MKYEFELFDYVVDKIDEQIECFIDFKDDRIHYKLESFVNKEPLLGEEEESFDNRQGVYVYEELVYKREDLRSIQMFYNEAEKKEEGEEDTWIVSLIFSGTNEVVKIRFLEEEKAKELHRLAEDYLFNKSTKRTKKTSLGN